MRPRTVFITGASSGLGRAMAGELAARGAHVTIAARRLDLLEEVAGEIRAKGGRALPIKLDVRDAEAVSEAVRLADREMGSLDMVIANAGVGKASHASTLPWSDIDEVLAVNVNGALATLMAAVPIMLAYKRGHLVAISSLAGRRGLPRMGAYSASKAALSTFAETLRMDLARAGVRVTDVRPGFIETPLIAQTKHARPLTWPVDLAARTIVKRLERQPRVITFPWPLVLLTSLGRVVPGGWYETFIRRMG